MFGIDAAVRRLAPFSIALMLTLLCVTPTYLPRWAEIAPPLPLMAVYYWALRRPNLMSAPAAFAVGLLWDALSGAPLGHYALILVLVHWVLRRDDRLRFGDGFVGLWGGFLVVQAGVALLHWGLASLVQVRAAPTDPVILGAALSAALFPCAAWLFGRVDRAFLEER